MPTSREPSGSDRGRWPAGEFPPHQRHPGFDRYPPPNVPYRNREPDPSHATPPPTRPLRPGGGESARPDDRAAPARGGDRGRSAGSTGSTGRTGRFGRVFGALSGSRAAPAREPATPGRTEPAIGSGSEPRRPGEPGAGYAAGRPHPGSDRATPRAFDDPSPAARARRPDAHGEHRHGDPPGTIAEGGPGAARRDRRERGGRWSHGNERADSGGRPEGGRGAARPGFRDRAGEPGPGDLPPTKEYPAAAAEPGPDADGRHIPRKLTVTRVAAMRGRELTERGIATFRRAAEADGADKSGLTALTYATMANFALDAAIAVALANTLFFASATAESKSKVALYLLITIAPFAIIAPLIGPALDRLQRGRRLALASSFAVRAVLAVVLIFSFDSWVLYPLALCMMVLSKSFAVLKSAVTPRVLPPDIDLVRTNSRLTVFGLVGGTLGAGGIAGAVAAVAGSTGALVLAIGIAGGGTYLSWKIPRWVEITEGEVPATLGYHRHDPETEVLEPDRRSVPARKRRQPLGRGVITGLWGNSSIRVLTGFLTFYVAFVAKATEHRPVQQAAMLGMVGAAAAVGNFAGNATGARLKLGRPSLIVVNCTLGCTVVAILAVVLDNLFGAALAALVAAAGSALAKVSLDAAIQDDLPPESVASGFGRSETVLQLSWVVGGAGGVLLPTDYWKGFAVVSALLAVGLVQTVLSYRGSSLLPGLGGRRPLHAEQEFPHYEPPRGDTVR